METALTQLGLSDKEVKLYLFLLDQGVLSAAEIAKAIHESRTNTYMILERLVNEGLIKVDDNSAIKRFAANDPLVLQKRLANQQRLLNQTSAALKTVLPDLNTLFNLGQHKPGVVYLEGIEGLKTLLEDNAKTAGSIDLVASDEVINNKEAWELLQKGVAKRAARGLTTRGLFRVADSKHKQLIKMWGRQHYSIKFWGKEPLPGEIVVYGSKVAFVVYRPTIVVTIITNEVLAQTFRVIFNQLWASAKS